MSNVARASSTVGSESRFLASSARLADASNGRLVWLLARMRSTKAARTVTATAPEVAARGAEVDAEAPARGAAKARPRGITGATAAGSLAALGVETAWPKDAEPPATLTERITALVDAEVPTA